MAVSWSYNPPSTTGYYSTEEIRANGTITGTWTSETRTTAAGTAYSVPGFSQSTSIQYYRPLGKYQQLRPVDDAVGKDTLTNAYNAHAESFKTAAEQGDLGAAISAGVDATIANQNVQAGQTQEFIDQETINPDETNQFFEDIAGAYNPGESRGDFYDRSVQDQQTSLDYYQSQTGFDAGNLDATVQGQVQIRDDILNQTVAISSQNVANALTLLGAMGIDTSTMQAVTNPDGTVSYTTPEGQDLSSVISALGTSLGTKIDDAGAANLAALGYGGEGQDDLFTDIGKIQTTLGSGLDMSSVTDAVSQGFTDQKTYLGSQFGEIAGDISGVGGQVTDVQATVDAVETAVGELDTRQLDMVTKLDNLGVDTDAIIAAVDAVQKTVAPLGGQVTDLGQSTAQAVSGLGGDVSKLFGNQDSTAQVVDAVSTRLSSDLGVGDASLSSIASSIATVGEAQTDDQKALVNQIGLIQTGVTNMDTAIKTNIDDEFKNLMTVFDSDGQLITDFTNAAGEEVKAQLNDDGTLVVSTLTQLGTDVGNIDLSSLDTMKDSIDAAAGSFDTAEGALDSFTSFETKSANDRKAVLDAIKDDSTALDTLINTGIPQTISTGLADYKLEVGANDELLITNLAAAVGFDQSDVASATATAVGFNQANVASAAASAVGFNQSNLVSALDTAVAYDSAALVTAIGFDPTKLSTAASDATKAAGLAKTSKDYSVWGFERVKTIQNSVLPQLVGDEAAITDLINGQTTTIGEDVAEINAQNELLLTSADGVETNLGLLDTSSIQSAVDGLQLLTANDVTNAVDLSDLSTLDGKDIRASVNTSLNANTAVANIKTVVDNIKSGALDSDDLATLGELDASVITNLVDKVDQKVAGSIDKEDLISRIQSGRLSTTDLGNLELLDSQDITDAVDLSGLSTLDAAQVASAVDYDPIELTSDFTTAIGNSQKALSDLQAGQTTTIKGAIGTYQAAVDDEGTLLVSAFNNLDGSIIALDTEVGNIDVSSLDTILSGVQAIPTTALSAQQVTDAVGYNAQDLLDSIAEDALTDADLVNLSTLTLDDIPAAGEIAGEVDYDPDALMARIKAGKADDLTELDLIALSTLTKADLSDLATQETASQAAASAASAVVSLGPISGISSNIDSLLTAANADATANGLRDSAIAESRADVLKALSQDEGAMRALFSKQTVDIQGELGDYNVRIDSETGSIVASQLSTQTSNLSGLIDTATGTLLKDSASGLTALEQDILDSKNDLYSTLNTSFTSEGELITNAINANGDDITRVLDDQGTLTETITDVNGIVQDTVVTNLSSIMDDTGRINTTALEIAADTNAESIFSTVQNVFDNQGLLKTEEYDRFNNLIIREFDENNDILERYYNADGTLSGEKVLRLEELLSSLFPDAPLAEAGELTGADKRFLQGFRTQGLMSGV